MAQAMAEGAENAMVEGHLLSINSAFSTIKGDTSLTCL
jgi:hypothetical protein